MIKDKIKLPPLYEWSVKESKTAYECYCSISVAEQGRICNKCRQEAILDYNFIDNFLGAKPDEKTG